jgi:hypothetical protein
LGATAASPLFVAGGVPATLSNSASAIVCQPNYWFWAVPNPNDVTLYQYLASHNYMLLSQGNNALTGTGAEALQYNLPNNYLLMSLLLTLRDSTAALVDPYTTLDNVFLDYNGTARYDRRDIVSRTARQLIHYMGLPGAFGQLWYDGTDLDFEGNGMNMSRWLDMYEANNPRLIADVAAAFAVNGLYSVLREQIVPANVTLV